MARGNIAKEALINKIIGINNIKYIGMFDKKYYFEENDGGEMVQIAISLTCPKVPVEFDKTVTVSTGDLDFSDNAPASNTVAVTSAAPAEITESEMDNLAALMAKLGL